MLKKEGVQISGDAYLSFYGVELALAQGLSRLYKKGGSVLSA